MMILQHVLAVAKKNDALDRTVYAFDVVLWMLSIPRLLLREVQLVLLINMIVDMHRDGGGYFAISATTTIRIDCMIA